MNKTLLTMGLLLTACSPAVAQEPVIQDHYKEVINQKPYQNDVGDVCKLPNPTYFPELFSKNQHSYNNLNNHEQSLNLGKKFEMKSKSPSRKTYQSIFRLTK